MTLCKKKKTMYKGKKVKTERKTKRRGVSELDKGTHPKNEKQDPCTAHRHLLHSTHS